MRKRNMLKTILIVALAMGLISTPNGITAAGSGFTMDMNLKDSDASFTGEGPREFSGCSIGIAGDINGDGYDDILIGAYGGSHDVEGFNPGETYLIFGKVSGWSMRTRLWNADASFRGERDDDVSGFSVAGAGDVNGDGFDDILVGAHRNDEGGFDAGQTYLILGKASGWSMDTNLSTADASFWGEEAGDLAGRSIAGAGDVNGDGYDDILIGAPYNGEGGLNAGQTYLILGKASGWSMDTNLSTADASFLGERYIGISGWSIAGAGDVNGDGYDDILIGAQYNAEGGPNAGQTHLILGKASGWSMDTNLSNSDASFWGEEAGDFAGRSIAGAGDVNGDGYDDILIGAPDNDEGGFAAGQTYLILGKASGWSMDTNLSTTDASFRGEGDDDMSGYSVAGAGDVNGDGYDEILIGAEYGDDGGTNAGQTYLILGKASGWKMDTDVSNADASFLGEQGSDRSGRTVAGGGDVNGDGYDDILIGAQFDRDGGQAAGQTYLVLSRYRQPPTWGPMPSLNAVEDVPVTYDFTEHVSDKETPTSELEISSPSVYVKSINGLNVTFLFPDGILSPSVVLNLSDAFDMVPIEIDFIVQPVNDPPEINFIPVSLIEVPEDETYQLLITGEDEEDEVLTWSDDTDLFDISPTEGTISFLPTQLEVREWWVNITVEDSGGLTDEVLIRFVVLNVNDEPIILSLSPENGSKYKEGKMVPFAVEATDEDGDDLTVTWTSDGETIGTGETLDYKKLKPGTRTIKVTVSDREASVEDEFTVVIQKEEESPALGGVFVLLAMLVGLTATMMRRKG